ncbi:MAG: hypothetical protein JKX85_06930, partial [Phycisphaeraceae bacterium]|nr:hypothetical protein [Phycisphaeraceae bacterium]
MRLGNVSAWTIDPTLPLRVQTVRSYDPGEDGGVDAAQVNLYEGGSASLVIAVDAGTSRLTDLQVTSDLPASMTFHRLAVLPVYDGPTVDGKVKGKLLGTRYDPMVPLDYALDPESKNGIHMVVATITPSADTTPGTHAGSVTLNFAGKTLTLPVALRVSPLKIKPKLHFGAIVGLNSFFYTPRKGHGNTTKNGISIATYHGLDANPRTLRKEAKPVLDRYFHTIIDNHLFPQSPALGISRDIGYRVIEQGPGLAPKLADWDFSGGYNDAIREFIIDRGAGWFMVGRSNGKLMSQLRLKNRKTYSVKDNPKDPNWVKLSREQFDQLVGDYWNAMAQNMNELGILDRCVFVIDESVADSYENMAAYVMAMKSRPYSKHFKIGH